MITAIDLFCGAGGLALGLASSGIDVRMASDLWAPAAKTYAANFPSHSFKQADIRDLTSKEVLDANDGQTPTLIAGGPPCQGFSSAGARADDDVRNTLVGCYATLAAEVRPPVIVFENVEGFLTAGAGKFVRDLLDPLVDAGYSVRLEKLNVANFGVPQLRKRVIAIAALGRDPLPLQPTHSASGAPGVWRVGTGLPHTVTVTEALAASKPQFEDPLNKPREPKGIELARIEALLPGQTMRDLPEDLRHGSWSVRANRRVKDGMPTEKRGGAPAGMRRLSGNEPSKAITGAATREFVHPTLNRTLTLREAATLQTFPANFAFVGNRAEIATMIGNAIPPVFAHALANAVRDTLSQRQGEAHGAVVAFNPTNADAMSPALAKVTRMVTSRYPTPETQLAIL